MNAHHEAVARIAAQVRSFYDRKEHFRIYHGSSNSTRKLHFSKDKIVDTTHLNHVLKIDRLHHTAFCEPNVSMEKLFRECIKGGMVPQVVMEFPGITVGGGYAGSSGESSSFRYGLFENTIRSIEIVLGDGQVVKASKTERADLLEAAAGSFGTFGVTTMLEVQLMPAKHYVELDCLPVDSVTTAITELEIATNERFHNDYVDGIVFNKHLAVVMTGQMVDNADPHLPVVHFTRPKDEWFYRYIEKRLADDATSPFKITIPLKDYLFRYDRGAFWGGKWAFQYFMFPFTQWTRYLFDSFMRAEVMYHALHKSGLANQNVVQDIAFPASTAEDFLKYLDQDFGFYPLWLCPLNKDNHSIPLRPRTGSADGDMALNSELMINVGLWGPGPTHQQSFIEANRQIEKKTRDLFGIKCLYARAYYTEDEFWQIYDKTWYDETRQKYSATTLPTVYDKTKTDLTATDEGGIWDVWPVAGVYGALSAMLAVYGRSKGDYVLERQGRVLKWYQVPLLMMFAIVLHFISRWM
jgi:Delta24-sterol reductase